MKIFLPLLLLVTLALFTQCKKKKLENPFGLMKLGSDTTLEEGRYIIRTKYDCNGYAQALTSDYRDDILHFGTSVWPNSVVDSSLDQAIWYVKKVRYIDPNPDYALAHGYRIYQYFPDEENKYRFFSMYSTYRVSSWENDEIGDGGGPSVLVNPVKQDYYPVDPNVPHGFATSTETDLLQEHRIIFQFYKSKDNPDYRQIRTLGGEEWRFCTAFYKTGTICDGAMLPHFRFPYADNCRLIDDGTTRCYIDDFYFQKVD